MPRLSIEEAIDRSSSPRALTILALQLALLLCLTGAMLDSFEILTTSGVVLWSKQYAPVGANVVNSFIRDVFIEDRSAGATGSESAARNPPYKKDKYTLKWTTAKDLGLIFVVHSCITSSYSIQHGAHSTLGSLPVPHFLVLDRQAS